TPPSLTMMVTVPDRLEVGDSVRVLIVGADDLQGSGIARAGVTVEAFSPRFGSTEVRVFSRQFQPARGGTLTEALDFPPFNFGFLPDTVSFRITAFLEDAQGNCAVAVAPGQTQSLPCEV